MKNKIFNQEIIDIKTRLDGLKKPLLDTQILDKNNLNIDISKMNCLRHENWIHPPNKVETHLKLIYK